MIHPFQEFLETKSLTPRAFAVFSGISLNTVNAFLYGKCRTVPAKIEKILAGQNVDTSDLNRKYSDWLLWRARQDVMELQKGKEE